MMMKKLITGVILGAMAAGVPFAAFAQNPGSGEKCQIVPKPQKMQIGEGAYTLTPGVAIRVQAPELQAIGEYLAAWLKTTTGLTATLGTAASGEGGIALILDPTRQELGNEGYILTCTAKGVTISAPKPTGVFYAVQTLRQLLPLELENQVSGGIGLWSVPYVMIEDWPRFSWRGYLLDPARHFRTKDEVKRYIDLLAFQKLNRFQLHLTDDQGWRVEIKRYPKLTEVGARRANCSGATGEGWFYTQEEIRELVAYAESRYVMIIPEIEMPGHSGAAVASYPELLGCGGKMSGILCISQDTTIEFATNVLSEIMGLFPAPFIHVGADEVSPGQWRACPTCGPRMKTLMEKELPTDVSACRVKVETNAGVPFNEDVARMQGEFNRVIDQHLQAGGRRMVGWDEIMDGGLKKESRAIVMAWRGEHAVAAAMTQKRDMVVSLFPDLYLDNGVSLEQTYTFEPVPEGVTPAQENLILGVQGNMWGEGTPTIKQVDARTFPRLCAIAEIGWSARKDRSFQDFSERLNSLYLHLDFLGVNFINLSQNRKLFKNARWIWTPEGDPAQSAPAGARTFQHTLILPADRKLVRARCWMTADNRFELKVNDKSAGQGDDWTMPVTMDVTAMLTPGPNRFSVTATNVEAGPAGLIGTIQFEFETGNPLVVTTTGQWQGSVEGKEWLPVKDLGAYGMVPWNKF